MIDADGNIPSSGGRDSYIYLSSLLQKLLMISQSVVANASEPSTLA